MRHVNRWTSSDATAPRSPASTRALVAALGACALIACGSGGAADGGARDAGARDAGARDAATTDAGGMDAGPFDAGAVGIDAGGPDARARLLDTQGDLMIWGGPEFALDCTTGQDPETGIRCAGDTGGIPHGLEAGWVWSLSIPRYSATRREQLYAKVLGFGYTHVAIQVTACAPGNGYHGLYPVSDADCAGAAALLNTVLGEIRAHGLVTWCTGVTDVDPPQPGLDASLCDLALDDWDNTDQKDCHIDALAHWFPGALHFVEMPSANLMPRADACTPAGLLPAADGAAWIAAAQARDPNFVGVAYEVNYPDGHDANLVQLRQLDAWWHPLVQNRFETDTYWKFWDGVPFDTAIAYNDWFLANAPWLHGFMSGGTAHAPP